MRRVVSSVTVALGLLGATVALAGVAAAAPAPGASGPPAANPGQKRCTITDERLRELSGLVATKSGFIVINDGTEVPERKRVFFLDSKCKISKEPIRYSGQGPFDTEDLALSKDGRTLWIADTGDNPDAKERRSRVALWSMPVTGAKQPTLHRLSYPEAKPHDAEALIIGDDGKPLIITKVTSGKAEIYTPSAALKSGDTDPVPMRKAGELTLPKTQTENTLNTFGRIAITGASRAPDGSRVVLRTYADAFEFDVSGGDIVGALTSGKPRVTPLADPFGEAISYTPDGKSFLTVSEAGRFAEDEPLDILSYAPSSSTAVPLAPEEGGKPAASKSWTAGLSLDDITYLVGAVGLIGLLLVAAGIFGIVRARRRPPTADASDPSDPDGEPFGPRAGRAVDGLPADDDRRGGVYGGGAPAGGAVYGGGPGRGGPAPAGGAGRGGPAPAGGAVYGGGGRPAPADGGYGAPRPDGGGAGVYGGGGRPPAGGGGRPPAGGGGRPQGGGTGRPQGGGSGRPGGGVYGGEGGQPGRAEPPRRGGPEPDYRGQRPGRRRDDDAPVDPYGQYPGGGRGHRGDRY
ncbi:hypothetical protein ACFYL6_22590 [Micromonospora sp. NPDC007208]|uniref:hypothetical protein n=1 Tax=Micromonospora sp. NPDC007208 TaxID=3364236 RepID=UPI0036A75C87